MSKTLNINDTGFEIDDVVKPEQDDQKDNEDNEDNQLVEINDTKLVEQPQNEIISFNQEKRNKLLLINKYKTSQRFSKYLIEEMKFNLDTNYLQQLSEQQLDTIITDIRYCVSNRNNTNFFSGIALKTIAGFEIFVSKVFNKNISGLTHNIQKSESFMDALEELTLENQTFTSSKPTTRMMFEVLQLAYLQYEANESVKLQAEKDPEQFKKDLEQLKKIKNQSNEQPLEIKYRDLLE